MRSLLIVIIHRIDCRKNNFAGRTATNLSHIYSLTIVVDKGEDEKIQFSTATDPGQLIFHDLTFDNWNPGVSAESLVTRHTSLKLFASGSGLLKICIQYLQQNFSFKYGQIPKFFQLLVGFAIFSLK